MRLAKITLLSGFWFIFCLAGTALAAEPVANAGSLTCKINNPAQLAGESPVTADVDCKFDAITGEDFFLTGQIEQRATAEGSQPATVWTWTVLAPTASVDPELLSGRYTGTRPGTTEKSDEALLYSSKSDGVALRPLKSSSPVLGEAGLTILVLKSAKIKI